MTGVLHHPRNIHLYDGGHDYGCGNPGYDLGKPTAIYNLLSHLTMCTQRERMSSA